MTLPQRWNLLFRDFKYEQFEKNLVKNKSINLLHLNDDLCCRFLTNSKSCDCPDNFDLQEYFFKLVVDELLQILTIMLKQDLKLTDKLECNITKYNNNLKSTFDELYGKHISLNHPLIYNDNDVLRVKTVGSIEVGTSNGIDKIATFDYDNDITVIKGKQIDPIKPFYRVGTAHVISTRTYVYSCKYNEYNNFVL